MFIELKIKSFNIFSKSFLRTEFFDNSVRSYMLFLGILLFGYFFQKVIAKGICKIIYLLTKRDRISFEMCFNLLRKPISLLCFFLIIYLAFHQLHFPNKVGYTPIDKYGFRFIIERTFQAFLIAIVSWIFIRFVKYFALIFHQRALGTESKVDDQLVPFFKDLAIVAVVISTSFLMLGRVFNVDVMALLTGLGISGLAIALAAKETLENLFASLTILIDKPFSVGDNVQIEKVAGDIEKIGFRSTRIRTNDGSLVTMPNRLLTSQALDNLSKRDYRRARYSLHFRLDTDVILLQKTLKEITISIENHESTSQKQGGVRIEGFSENAIEVLVLYYIQTQDYWRAQKTKEDINIEILQIMQRNGVSFAAAD